MSKDAEVIDWLVAGDESKVKGGIFSECEEWRNICRLEKVRIERKITGRRKGGQVLRGGDGGLYFFI